MRWLRFYIVGAMGAAVQFALLAFLARIVSMHYLLATVLSVEAAILHNFIWHWRWTWHDRHGASGPAFAALARFNLTNGLVSISANLLSAYLLTGVWRIDPVIASLASTAIGSLASFFLSDHLVFASSLGRATPCNCPRAATRTDKSLQPAKCSEGKLEHTRAKVVGVSNVAVAGLLRNQRGVAEGGMGVKAIGATAFVPPGVAKPAVLRAAGRHIGVSNSGGHLGLSKAL